MVGMRCSTWGLVCSGLGMAEGSTSPSCGGRQRAGLSACRGSPGLESGPEPNSQTESAVARTPAASEMRSGWGAAMPSRSNGGKRRLCWALTSGGEGRADAGGRFAAKSWAKMVLRSG